MPLKVEDAELFALPLNDAVPSARTREGVIRGAEDSSVGVEHREERGFVPNVITAGHCVNPERDELIKNLFRHAFSVSGVFAVYYGEVESSPFFPEDREGQRENLSALAPGNIAREEYSHFASSDALVSRATLTFIWPGYFISASILRAMSNAIL